jgi:ribosomal-protein-alanine N-acetyltransferase
MQAVMAAAGNSGITRLFLEHAASNIAAGALYDRFGFKPIGRRRAYYERRSGGREDAITLSCEVAAAEFPERRDGSR